MDEPTADTTNKKEEQKQNGSVMIVDDDQFLLDMYTVKFQGAGYTVVGHTDSKAALEELRKGGSYDALLLDLIMPGIDGFELMRIVREENLVGEQTALIILSNQGQDADMENAKQYHIDGYLIKASTVPSEVLSYVQKAIDKKKS
jgi:CheY-like chemotaxis protein